MILIRRETIEIAFHCMLQVLEYYIHWHLTY